MSLLRTALTMMFVGLPVTASIALAMYPEPVRGAPKTAAPTESAALPVPPSQAARSPYPPKQETFLGVILARRSVDLAPRDEGRIIAVNVRLGDAVRAGSVVATINVPTLRFDLGMARASADAAQVDEERAAIELAQAEELLGRRKALSQMALTSGEDLASATFQEKLARTRVLATSAALAERRSRVNQLSQQTSDLEIRAPFDGIVTARYLDPGANVTSTTPIVRIISASDLFVRFAVSADRTRALKIGRAVIITSGADTLHGAIEKVAPEVDAASRMVVVEAQVNAAGEARSGEMVTIALGDEP